MIQPTNMPGAVQGTGTTTAEAHQGGQGGVVKLLVQVVQLLVQLLQIKQQQSGDGQTANSPGAGNSAGGGGASDTGNGSQNLGGFINEFSGLLGQLLEKVAGSTGSGEGSNGGGSVGHGGGAAATSPADEPIFTTQALGEEDSGGDIGAGPPPGGDEPDVTTLAVGEEGGDRPGPIDGGGKIPPDDDPIATTLAIGEEGGDLPGPIDDGGLIPPDDDQIVTTLAIGEEGGDGPGPIDGGVVSPNPPTPGEPVSAGPLQDGIRSIDRQNGQTTGFADNEGNSINVEFDRFGDITGLTTTVRQAESMDADGNVTSFSDARFTIDINQGTKTGTSSITQGPLPTEPEPEGEVAQFIGNRLTPAFDGNGNINGFRDSSIADEGSGRELTFTTDQDGNINGYRVTDYATVSFIAGAEPSLSVIGFSDYDLAGNLLATALA